MTNSRTLLSCPSCEAPFEQGEALCFTCHSPLSTGWQSAKGAYSDYRRRRAARIAAAGTGIVYCAAFFWLIAAHAPLWSRYKFGSGRDVIFATEILILLGAGLLTYGKPGRTLHHYPSFALIRRGAPRWWKGLGASAILVGSAVLGLEGVLRPALEDRGSNSILHSQAEIAAAIDTWVWTTYLAVALVLAWNLIATRLPPQVLSPGWRQQLMENQERKAARLGE
ncbi:hypothetical protein [Homoserinimonas hongtaonis]|uniref:hypothetical protein n=1 Tax=Homoserinimonas hongtaonis TaxID=2079791 RepID=UPI0011B2440B|nr:hypothetical protein [Salinibacterium hongtaonis]